MAIQGLTPQRAAAGCLTPASCCGASATGSSEHRGDNELVEKRSDVCCRANDAGRALGRVCHRAGVDHRQGSEKLEVDVTNSPDLRNGQTEVAINPRNPNNLVFTATRFGPSDPVPPGPCFVADSRDRGKTWTEATWPSGTGSNPDTRRNCAPELSGGC